MKKNNLAINILIVFLTVEIIFKGISAWRILLNVVEWNCGYPGQSEFWNRCFIESGGWDTIVHIIILCIIGVVLLIYKSKARNNSDEKN